MNNRTTKFFFAIHDNQVVCLDNTLAGFHTRFKKIEPKIFGYLSMFKRFQNADHFSLELSGKTYYFQKLV